MEIINHRPYTVTALEDLLPAVDGLFIDVLSRLNKAGIDYALGSGTALGIHRDRQLIPTDTDLDFMVFIKSGNEEKILRKILRDFPLAVEVLNSGETQQLAYYPQNTIVDFHFYREHDGFMVCHHQAGTLRFIYTGTEQVATNYGPLRQLKNVELMLESEYGPTWKTPQYRKKGVFNKYKTGLLFGCFDPLHYGHIRLFRRCMERCERFIVVVRSDDHIRRYKGREPFVHQLERLRDVNTVVDEVYFDEGDRGWPSFAIWSDKLGVDVFFASEENQGKIELDVPVIYMPRTKGVSSTQIREGL
jgi:cytidyltransferase-like protein